MARTITPVAIKLMNTGLLTGCKPQAILTSVRVTLINLGGDSKLLDHGSLINRILIGFLTRGPPVVSLPEQPIRLLDIAGSTSPHDCSGVLNRLSLEK